ncbi:hypothetical protein LTR91_024859 [Friedmanniomyces endolithicus]|uniref:Uncharacterized protein n=1 Tax=Friedmanniomyces endolithicus TaxID=329885 RepID=A0AAN6K010_9PEZI|nr:hypothetical protein LTR94_010427 [Friedmanniomyces endolithicus]KAK0772293.1 hypothetical protein LTR75_017451 [Friedmanniomyces endolithicus]KAK0782447.1 hypothetical protein LTR38_013392 [Friedmanniomyces endolithicus]KAK0786622.1 hypothetical protein LTR59_010613 [Friedmanniomyces endolithicus]KAK0854208.1 hypothetical protein LTS02_011649 [Friedmanniomyces endolithicus]
MSEFWGAKYRANPWTVGVGRWMSEEEAASDESASDPEDLRTPLTTATQHASSTKRAPTPGVRGQPQTTVVRRSPSADLKVVRSRRLERLHEGRGDCRMRPIMDPTDAFYTDRLLFDAELTRLMNEANVASSSIHAHPAAVKMRATCNPTPRLEKRVNDAAEGETKRRKLADPIPIEASGSLVPTSNTSHSPRKSPINIPTTDHTEKHALHVHPSRQVLLDRPIAQHSNDLPPISHSTAEVAECARSSPSKTGRIHTSLKTACLPTSPEFHAIVMYDRPHPCLTAAPVSQDIGPKTTGPHTNRKTWDTVRNAVQRHVDPRKDDLEYESLLRIRRNEKTKDIDRYVPESSKPRPPKHMQPATRRSGPFSFQKLPETVRSRILTLLLVSSAPISLDFTWLRSFFAGHSRVPNPDTSVEHNGVKHQIPKSLDQVINEVDVMQQDMMPFRLALEQRADKTRPHKSPCIGLTASLLRVSRVVHKDSARILYEQNTFSFLCPTTAWMLLELFLITIGSTNVARIQSLEVHVPLWHQGLAHGYIEGAILDLASPVSRLAVIKPPARDRLLAAVEQCVFILQQAGQLTDFKPRIRRSGKLADEWIGRVSDDKSTSGIQLDELVVRKRKGTELLRQLTETLPLRSPPTLCNTGLTRLTYGDSPADRERLENLKHEAAKYGWQT